MIVKEYISDCCFDKPVKAFTNVQTVWELTGNTGTVITTQLGGSAGMTAKRSYHTTQGTLTNLNTVKGVTSVRNMDYGFNFTL